MKLVIMKRFFIATFIGALIAFSWGYLSWELLSWHKMDNFKNSAAVSEVLIENTTSHGIYMLPSPSSSPPNAEAITKGPFVYAIIRPSALRQPWSMTRPLIGSFCIQLIGSLIISAMVMRIRARRYISRASIGPIMGLFAGIMMTLPTWNWFELPTSHAMAYALDPFITWTLAGTVIAAIIQPKKDRRIFTKKNRL